MTMQPSKSLQNSQTPKIRGVTAVLGPTNTGKTHFAIERMLAHPTGAIGLPLRLLAREVYNRLVEKAGVEAVALITGEEKIKPARPRYWVSTVEAMPRDLTVSFVAIDEIQLAADFDRGHVFTDRLLNRRGQDETLLIGAGTMAPLIASLLPGAPIISRPRLSKLSFAGAKKIARLPRRSAIVAFSAEEVYAIAEWLRRQKGGAAVVLGALSPRTRNAQIDMYQNGEVDYVVATDAIGMGLNLDVETIAFASDHKFDGWRRRRLTPAEFGQIAGRAGRHTQDGFFCSTGRCAPFDEDLVESLEDHRFDALKILQWRNAALDFSTIADLIASLEKPPEAAGLTRAPIGVDQMVLERAARDPDVIRQAVVPADVQRLWDACQIPDYRKTSPAAHAELALTIYSFIVRRGRIPEDWIARRIAEVDRIDGDIDALSQRIAQVRTWSFIANRDDWLGDPRHWQAAARRVEDSLSDALHEKLAQRFVDRRTSLLRRRLRENIMLEAEINSDGDVIVEGQHVGQLRGFRFTADPKAEGEAARTLNAAAQKALAIEIEGRATRVSEAVDTAFALSNDGAIRWLGEPIAKIIAGDKILAPRALLVADETLSGEALEKVQRRLDLWLGQHVTKLLGGLTLLEEGEGLEGISRGLAFRLSEELGVVERARIANDVKTLSQEGRAALRKLGVRFGAYNLYLPALLKPAPRALAAQLWSLKQGALEGVKGLEEVAHLASSGRTSFAANPEISKDLYRIAGFRVAGERAVRVDILERLADLIRPAVAYRPGATPGDPPAGAADGNGFVVTVAMTSLAGCSGEAFASILQSLGFVAEKRPGPAITVALTPKAAMAPFVPNADKEKADEEKTSEEKTDGEQTREPKIGDVIASKEDFSSNQPQSAEGILENAPENASSAPDTQSLSEAKAEDVKDESAKQEAQKPEAGENADALDAHSAAPATPDAHERFSDQPDAEPAAITTPETERASETVAGAPDPGSVSENADSAQKDAEPAEPVLIEVWSPARHQRPQRRPDQQRRAPDRGNRLQDGGALSSQGGERRGNDGQDAASRGNASASRSGDARRDGRRDGGGYKGHRPRTGQDSSATPSAGLEDGKRFEGKPRSDTHSGKFAGKFSGNFDGKRDGGNRPFIPTEKRERERKPDPDSPFAKLLALKAELEKNKKS